VGSTPAHPELYHWFIGDGMVHGIRIRIRNGKAEWYRNRWVRGPQVPKALGERPPTGHFGISPIGANTNVIGHAGKTLALVEFGIPNYQLTDELDTVRICDFDGTLTGGYTAHPERDPESGELHAVSYTMYRGNKVQYSVIGNDGRARRTVDVEVGGGRMMHDHFLDRAICRVVRPARHVRCCTSSGDDCAPRAAPARPVDAVGLDRTSSHPRSHRRAPATAEGFRPAVPILMEPELPRPHWRNAA